MTYPTLKRLIETITNDDWNELAQFIHQNCQPWLNAGATGNDQTMWRCGQAPMIPEDKLFGVVSVRQDRRPRDSTPVAHLMFNEILKNTGTKANRENSVFATGGLNWGYSTATTYGRNCYAVIPVGEFDFVWSDKIYDLYSQTRDLMKESFLLVTWSRYGQYDDWRTSIENLGRQMTFDEKFMAMFSASRQPEYEVSDKVKTFFDTLLPHVKAVGTQQQVYMWLGHLYTKDPVLFAYKPESDIFAGMYALSRTDSVVHAAMDLFIQDIGKTYHTDNLAAAVKSTHEIMIHCPKVLLINAPELNEYGTQTFAELLADR